MDVIPQDNKAEVFDYSAYKLIEPPTKDPPKCIYLTGKNLREELDRPNLGQEPLIEELIYKDSITMFTARPGVGKSVVTTNICASGSLGLPIFGFLNCARPLKIAYMQMEGSRDEQISRLKMIEEVTGELNVNNISWHTPDFNVEDSKTWADVWMEIDDAVKAMSGMDVTIFDPIYAMTTKGLTNEVTCLAVKKFLDTVKYRYRTAVIVNNHSPKDSYANDGKKIKKKDPFGVTWLSANLDGSFFIDRGEEKDTITIERIKSRAGALIENLTLKFDIASFSLSTVANSSSTPARLKVRATLSNLFKSGLFPCSMVLSRESEISKRQLLRMKADGLFDDICTFHQEGKKLIWRPKDSIEIITPKTNSKPDAKLGQKSAQKPK